MKNFMKIFWECALSVAMATSDLERPTEGENLGESIAAYLSSLISLATDSMGNYQVDAIAYPGMTKFPMLIRHGSMNAGLFWYYTYWTDEQLREQLAERLMELSEDPCDLSALAGGGVCAHRIA